MIEEGMPEDEVNRILEELEAAAKGLGYVYVPHPKQKSFHQSLHKIRGVFGGNRSGKTEMGTLEAWFHASGEYPDWYPIEGRFHNPTRGRIVVTDYKKGANEVLEPKILKWFPENRVVKIDRFQGHIVKIHVRHKSGGISTMDVMTHEQDSMAFEGWSGHWVWFDEPPPREQFVACMRGLIDFRGRAWLTLTPISEPWLFDEIVGKADSRRVMFITVDIRDNPYLTEQEIQDFEATLSPDEVEARIHGNFIHLAGRIFKIFDPKIHCISDMPKGWQNWPKWFVLDPADRRQHCGIWACVDPLDNIYIYDEIYMSGTLDQLCTAILMKERSMGVNPDSVIRILDPNKGMTPTTVTGLKLVEEFGERGLGFTCNVNDDIALGHMAVSTKLFYDKSKPLSFDNKPKLLFLQGTTTECIKQILSYVWDDWKGINKGTRSAKETPKDVNKDFPDCVRYLVVSRPVWYQDEGSGPSYLGGRTGYAF